MSPNIRQPKEDLRGEVVARLQHRRHELERGILVRMHAIADPAKVDDAEYAHGLTVAVSSGVNYILNGLSLNRASIDPIPEPLLRQARLAAQHSVGLPIVLRYITAAHTLMGNDIANELGALKTHEARSLFLDMAQRHATLFDHLIDRISDEYARRQGQLQTDTPSEKLVRRLTGLLAGELIDTADIRYNFRGHHIGAISLGVNAKTALTLLAKELGSNLLVASQPDGVVWAWFGNQRGIRIDQLDRLISSQWSSTIPLALGEPSQGLDGWRLTFRQAQTAFPVAAKGGSSVVKYAAVALPASIIRDDLLATSLRRLYLDPLALERDGGVSLRRTLRAYLSAGCNGAAAAASLDLSRQTVSNHLRTAEKRIGRTLPTCVGDLYAALQLEDLCERLGASES